MDVFNGGFTTVYSKTTGAEQLVPNHFLDHPVLGADFTTTPPTEAAVEQASTPTEAWTHAQLDHYASSHEPPIDLTGATTKADKVALIAAGPTSADVTESSDQPPA